MPANERVYQIGLTLLEGIGDVLAKNLLAYCGSAEAVFRSGKSSLGKIPGIGPRLAASIHKGGAALQRAEQELRFIEKEKIQPLFYSDADYPRRLKNCHDSPVMLYYKGNAHLNTEKVVAVVGTRQPSAYGKQMCEQLIADLKGSGILVLSGLAYGVDVIAHKTALEYSLATVGILAHGLDRVYPGLHTPVATRMLQQGGLLCDFISGTQPDAQNFPRRNRIVAGMCDALIVIESKREGGSLITATIAHSYNRDVFAFPGRAGDTHSEGCNGLIKTNKAILIEHSADLLYQMQWDQTTAPKPKTQQVPLPFDLSEAAQKILSFLTEKESLHADELSFLTGLTPARLSAQLLELELANHIQTLPGKRFRRTG